MKTIEDLALKFLYLGIGAGVAAFLDQSLWTWTGSRQTNRLRGLYLASVLGQDISFFDTSATGTGGMLQVRSQSRMGYAPMHTHVHAMRTQARGVDSVESQEGDWLVMRRAPLEDCSTLTSTTCPLTSTLTSTLQGLNQDSADVQMAMSEKLGQTLKAASTFFTGFILAFIKGWDMTLVMLGCIPLMGVMGAVMMSAISKSTQTQNAAYARASMVAQQSISQVRTVAAPTSPPTPLLPHLPPHLSSHIISQIRTVAAYTQERRMQRDYREALTEPLQAGGSRV